MDEERNWKQFARPENEDIINPSENIPLCADCGGLMIESSSNAVFDREELIPIHMTQSYTCFNCENEGHLKIGFIDGEQITDVIFRKRENVDIESRMDEMDVDEPSAVEYFSDSENE